MNPLASLLVRRLKERAEAAERQLAVAAQHTQQLEARIRNLAVLSSITVDGKALKFTFVRNGQVHVIETYKTLDVDVNEWNKTLFGELDT